VDRLHAEGTGDVASAIIQLADMRSILIDGMAPANLMAARCMDADFPTLCGALDMDEIKNESEQFHQDVAAEISASGVPDADTLAEAFAEATAEVETPKSAPGDEVDITSEPLEGVSVEPAPTTVSNTAASVEAAAQVAEANLMAAEDLLAQIEAGQDLLADVGDSVTTQSETAATAEPAGQVETASTPSAETTAGTLSAMTDELAAMSEALSSTAGELGALTDTVGATVGVSGTVTDADLAAAMADMLAPSADAPEPIKPAEPSVPTVEFTPKTESVATPPTDDATMDTPDAVSAAAAAAALDAALAAAMEGGGDAVVEPPADTASFDSGSASMAAEPLVAEDLVQPPTTEPEASKPLGQVVEPAPPEQDPLADLLESAGACAEDAAQAEAFAALLNEPSPEADATLVAMMTAAVSGGGATEETPAVELPRGKTPAEQAVAAAAKAPSMTETDPPCPQVSESEAANAAPADEAGPAVVSQSEASLPSPVLDEVGLPAAAKPAEGLDAGDFRSQLEDIKNTLVSQIDRLGGLFDSVARLQEESQQTLVKALEVKQATDRAFEASRQYADVFAKAEMARAACQQAEAQVAAARMQWENAQQGASAAAQGVSPPARASRRSPRKRNGT